MGQRPIIVWFRRDLRVADNPALAHAAAQHAPIIPVYLPEWETGDRWTPGRGGRWWLGRSLERLEAALQELGSGLVAVSGPADEALPALAEQTGAVEVIWNRLYEPYSRDLDARVGAALQRGGVAWQSFNAALLYEPDGHLSSAGRPFVQFTAYWRSHRSWGEPEPPGAAPRELRTWEGRLPKGCEAASLQVPGPEGAGWAPDAHAFPWRPGEAGAEEQLDRFLECCLAAYDGGRDLLGSEGTSRLSPHLHFGEIGPRRVWHAIRRLEEKAAVARRKGGPPNEAVDPVGAQSYLRQIGWREFAHYILFHFPWIPEEPFRPEFARFPWQDDPVGLDAWHWGDTGYPLVDASARQLLSEGWVHNRARLVSASFLTKDLLIPWQEGAAWYWDRLVDADLANNTLGWQWTSGSGPDAAPYFRVFNPALQAARFDADDAYTRRWGPGDGAAPAPIVNHAEARVRALAAFRGLRTSGAAKELGTYPLPSDIQV